MTHILNGSRQYYNTEFILVKQGISLFDEKVDEAMPVNFIIKKVYVITLIILYIVFYKL